MRGREWNGYIERFHAGHAGITEEVLGSARSDGSTTPYTWLTASLPADAGLVVDLACGSGPLQPLVTAADSTWTWVGADLSPSELELARARGGPLRLLRADAGSLPVRIAAADAVICAMGLMVLPAVDRALDEVRRVVRAGGVVAFLLPAGGPLHIRDRLRYAHLLAALRLRHIPYPQPDVVAHPDHALQAAGFAVAHDERRTFGYTIADVACAHRLIDSLYLPNVSEARLDAARNVVARWIGSDIGIPLRRVVATA